MKIYFICMFALFIGNLVAINKSNGPIIGVLTQYSYNKSDYPTESYASIAASYPKWIEASGAKVVPIPHTATLDQLSTLLNKLNGVLIQGGGIDLQKDGKITEYQSIMENVFNIALDFNKKGDYFPVWGTCLGFESLAIWASQNPNFLGHDIDQNRHHNIKFTAEDTKLKSALTHDVIEYVEHDGGFYFNHHDIISTDNYMQDAKFNDFFKVGAVSSDENGKPFLATIEGKQYPFYGTQFHPEKNSFEWNTSINAKHTPMAVLASQQLGNFFVQEALKNSHSFVTEEEEDAALLFNFPTVRGHESFTEIYYLQLDKLLPNDNSTKNSFLPKNLL